MRTPPDDVPERLDSAPPTASDHDPSRERISGVPGGALAVVASYDNIHRTRATVYHPADVAELADILRKASLDAQLHHITFRAGGQSLDSQALNDDVVVYLDAPALSQVGEPEQDARGYHVTVGAGATWEAIVRKTSEHGLLPWSVVTTRYATAGGTAACDCLSRCSPISGKEGDHVRSFKLLTVDGSLVACDRFDPDPERRALFHAVIGGMGYLGVLVELTIDLRPPVPGWASHLPIRVLTHVDKYLVGPPTGLRWSDVLPRLEEAASQVRRDGKGHGIVDQVLHREDGPGSTTLTRWDAVSSSAWYALGQTQVMVFQSRFVVGQELDPLPFYDKTTPLLIDLPEGFESPVCTELAEGGMFFLYKARTYVNGLFDFLFFMGNQLGPIRTAARDDGWRLNAIQQTFLIPLAPPTIEDPSGTSVAQAFLEQVRSPAEGGQRSPSPPPLLDPLRPCFIDVLFLHADDFLLSATRDLPGFAITVTWTGKNAATWPRIQGRLRALSRACRELGGRVHMVKHVEADPEDLRAMYGDAFDRFLALKRRYDPRNLLRNEFFDRIFGPT